MLLLLISDIHGNYPALQAIERQFPPHLFNYIINCGDSLVYAPFPNETIDWLRKNRAISILGNTDKKVIKILRGESFRKPGKAEKRVMYTSTAAALTRKNSKYLKSMKKKRELLLNLSLKSRQARTVKIGIYHGSPAAPHEFLFDSTPDSRFAELADKGDCTIVITGHSHTPYHKVVSEVHFINPGSVGRMFDGNPAASCATVRITTDRIKVDHFRISYPLSDVLDRLQKENLPEIYCRMYSLGRKLN